MLVAQKDVITKITVIITPKSIDTLKNELGGAFLILKTNHYDEGEQCGFLATIIPEPKYCIVINNAAWVYASLPNPKAYMAAALAANVSAVQRKNIVAQHKEAQRSYAAYLGAQEAGK
jgi:hypothetical protein